MVIHMSEIVKLAANTDSPIISFSHAIEGPVLDAWSQFKKPYPVGIQVAPFGWEKGHLIEDETIRSFLDKHETNSVLYISFGFVTPSLLFYFDDANVSNDFRSHFFPVTTPEYVTALLSTLEELSFPFIFALGGLTAKNGLSADTISRINSSGKGLIHNSWIDQRGVLQHPSTGWFLTHGGFNSISESLAQGVPMICWPMSHGDQFMDAAMLSTRDEPVAFELLQTRMFEARGPPGRGGGVIKGEVEDVKREMRDVLTKARGKEGEVVRKNVEAMAKLLREERDGRADAVIKELAEI